MLFTIAVLVLILAITLRQATFGFFSAMIMATLTVCCAAAAMGMHEWVAAEVVAKYWNEDYALAVGLAVPFGIMLILLRLIADGLIPRACLVPALVDRVGGGICGFVTAMTIAGVASLSVEMLPLGRATFGFQRVPSFAKLADGASLPPEDAPQRELWLTPDRFVAGMTSMMSNGVFGSTRNFYREHPDYVSSIGWATAVPNEVSIYAPPGSISVIETGEPDVVYRMKKGKDDGSKPDEYEPIEAKSGYEFRSVRVKLGQQAARDRKYRFTLRQFRLVGQSNGKPEVIDASAIQQEKLDDSVNRHIRILKEYKGDRPIYDDVLSPREANGEVEVVFEVPTGFQPSLVEYKLGAQATVSFSKRRERSAATVGKKPTAPPPDSPTQPGESQKTAESAPPTPAPSHRPDSGRRKRSGRKRRGGNVRRVTSDTDLSFFGDAMPMELKSYRKLNSAEIRRGLLKSGHLVGKVDDQASGGDTPLTKFAVPAEKRLLQLNTRFLSAKSVFGKALAQAVKVAGNFFVTDDRGNRYKIIGKYAVASVNGTKYIEVQYFPDQAGSVGGLGPFSRIKDRDFKGDYTLVYLFLVDPGVTITDFSTGGNATRADDLRSANLVAPD